MNGFALKLYTAWGGWFWVVAGMLVWLLFLIIGLIADNPAIYWIGNVGQLAVYAPRWFYYSPDKINLIREKQQQGEISNG